MVLKFAFLDVSEALLHSLASVILINYI